MYCSSPVSLAKVSTLSCVVSTQSLTPSTVPTRSRSPARPSITSGCRVYEGAVGRKPAQFGRGPEDSDLGPADYSSIGWAETPALASTPGLGWSPRVRRTVASRAATAPPAADLKHQILTDEPLVAAIPVGHPLAEGPADLAALAAESAFVEM